MGAADFDVKRALLKLGDPSVKKSILSNFHEVVRVNMMKLSDET